MVWGSISASGGDVKIDGIIESEKYHHILNYHLTGNGFVFQSDNDAKRIASEVKKRNDDLKYTNACLRDFKLC